MKIYKLMKVISKWIKHLKKEGNSIYILKLILMTIKDSKCSLNKRYKTIYTNKEKHPQDRIHIASFLLAYVSS